MEWLPDEKPPAGTVMVATPLVSSGAMFRVAVPSLKVTVPVGVGPPAVPVAVAVKVTGWLGSEGLTDEVSAVWLLPMPSLATNTSREPPGVACKGLAVG